MWLGFVSRKDVICGQWVVSLGGVGIAARHRAFLPIGSNVLLFNDWKSDHSLFLYERTIEAHRALISFIESGLKNDELCLFAYDKTNKGLHPETFFKEKIQSGGLSLHPMSVGNTEVEIQKLNEKLRETYRQVPNDYHTLRVVADFGHLVTPRNFEAFLNCARGIIKKRNKRKCQSCIEIEGQTGRTMVSPRFRTIIALNIESLPYDTINTLFKIHENVVISTRNEHTMCLLNQRPDEIPDNSAIESIPTRVLEKSVKKHLEIISLSILHQNPMCGYDLIRTIYLRYHTFLSQGTVYPLLYSLESKGLVSVAEPVSSHSKVYALTDEGRRVAEGMINDFISSQRYLLQSIART